VAKNDQKKQFVSDNQEITGEQADSSYEYFDSPEAKIMASLRTQKYFDRSLLLASYVEDEFKKEGRTSWGVKQRNYEGIWVLQATAMPSVLVETGFICNPDEEDYLNSEKGQNEVTYAVTRAVLRYKQSLEEGINNVADTVALAQ
jgi:N-acetylmuramoyl-L-alanine amidase